VFLGGNPLVAFQYPAAGSRFRSFCIDVRAFFTTAFTKFPQGDIKPVVALFENHPDILYIHFKQAGDGFRRLTVVMSTGKNIPLEFGPLTKSPENFTEQIITAYFCSGG